MNTVLARERTIESLLRPRSIAVVGASDSILKIGGRPLHYLLRHGYGGALYPVTQRGEPVQGLRSYTSLDELPQAPDCVILSVPATAALAQVEACVRAGARSAILFSSGFAEMGPQGRLAQADLLAAAAEGGLRLLGPNTIGTANFGTGAVLSFASIYQDFAPQDGPVAVVAQSGAVGASAYAMLRDNGLGVRYVCTTGNQADVEVSDFVQGVLDDPTVSLVLLYLEEARDLGALEAALGLARSRGVPVLALAAARSASGARMAHCHTGSEGTSDGRLARTLEAQGCRLVASLPELTASAALYLAAGRPPRLPRVAIVSNSGASCVMGADACDAQGLALAQVSPSTISELDALLPPFSRSRNPVDLTAMLLADAALLERSVSAVLHDPNCDALALSLLAVAGTGYDVPRFAAETAAAVHASGKPAVFSSPDGRIRQAFAGHGLAVFASETDAVAALGAYARHHA
ncbi:MAG: CoA-binding protein [Burkholderiales bacterium]|nr:CoA-binding protein [Burkholderiales bacterium]